MNIQKMLTNKALLSYLFTLGLSVLVYTWYQGSCWMNHSKPVKEIGIPMVENVLGFFKAHQRYPTFMESEILFTKAGCQNINQSHFVERKNHKSNVYQRLTSFDCNYKSKVYEYSISIADLITKPRHSIPAYKIGFSEGNSHCSATFHKDGSILSSFHCQQFSCFKLDH